MGSRGWLALLLLIGLAACAALAWRRAEGAAPRVEAPAEIALGAAGGRAELGLSDPDSGLRHLEAHLIHARGEVELVRRDFPGSWITGGASREERVVLELAPPAPEVPDGSAVLRVAVRDWSWRANQTAFETPVEIDRKPPRISLESGLSYVDRGGSGAVAYSVSEPTVRDGVEVGTEGEPGAAFYRGFATGAGAAAGAPDPGAVPAGRRVALFAVGRNAPPKARVQVVALDRAGNAARASWALVLKEKPFPQGNVTLPEGFLESKAEPLARAAGIPTQDLVESFRAVNTDLRRRNEDRIRELTAQSEPVALFRGAFEQLRNSKVTSRFAEDRIYFVRGQRVSEATHYGYDLASTAGATITAANAGRVLFAGDLGIYGECVLLDHGLGLASLYGHLSQIDVAAGDRVEKGQALGRSGETGLAGGDHLHFALLLGGTYVDPVEWWDPKWVAEHVETALSGAPP
jgi:murein DD-endopeptidase MepM/ murein hydrolase activator NlpD